MAKQSSMEIRERIRQIEMELSRYTDLLKEAEEQEYKDALQEMVERFNIKTVEAVAMVTKILEEAHYNNTEPRIPIRSFLTRPEDQQPAQAAEPAAEPEKKDDTSADDDDFTFDGLFDDMVEEESAEGEKNE